MQRLRAKVRNGRIVLDEPTDLPEGAEVEVAVVDGDDLGPEERAELHASLDRALDDSEAGRMVDAWKFLEEHRAARAATGRTDG
jgi:hypothetical protein